MANYEWIPHGGKMILYMNASCATLAELNDKIKEFKSVIVKQPPVSILAITDLKGTKMTNEMVAAMTEFANHNKPYMKMAVIIGLEGLKEFVFTSVIRITGRKNVVARKSMLEALEFLASENY